MPIRTLRFFQEGHFSSLVRMIRFSIFAMYGDREAELLVRKIWQESQQEITFTALHHFRDFLLHRARQKGLSNRILPYLIPYQKNGLPYANFEKDPALISQIKIIINACYHAEEVLKTVESIDLYDLMTTFQKNSILETIDHVYELCQLITHPDIDLNEIFANELYFLTLIANQLSSSFTDLKNNFSGQEPVVQELAGMSGNGLYLLTGLSNRLDYSSLAEFSVHLPQYFHQMTQQLKKLSHGAHSTPMDDQQYFELQANHYCLLYSLEQLNHKSIFNPVICLDLINTLHQSHALIWNILDEVAHLKNAGQIFINESLKKLKLEHAAFLIAIVDKIEEECSIRSGQMSYKVFQTACGFYEELIHLIREKTPFSIEQDLNTLRDTTFLAKRLDYAYLRRAEKLHQLEILNSEHSSLLLESMPHLQNAFEKQQATLKHYLQLNEDVIHAIYKVQEPLSLDNNQRSFEGILQTPSKKMDPKEAYLECLSHYQHFLQAKSAFQF